MKCAHCNGAGSYAGDGCEVCERSGIDPTWALGRRSGVKETVAFLRKKAEERGADAYIPSAEKILKELDD